MPTSFAGLRYRWETTGDLVESFDLMTTPATPLLTDIHHRLHNIIEPDNFSRSLALDSPYDRLQELARW